MFLSLPGCPNSIFLFMAILLESPDLRPPGRGLALESVLETATEWGLERGRGLDLETGGIRVVAPSELVVVFSLLL